MRIVVSLYLFISVVTVGLSQNQSRADSVRKLVEEGSLDKEQALISHLILSENTSSPEEMISSSEKVLELARQLQNEEYIIRGFLRLGVGQRLQGNLRLALTSLFDGANVASEKEKYTSLLGTIYAEISTCYTLNGDSENALLYGSKTIQILRSLGKTNQLALTLLNFGYDYYLIENYDSAMAYYNESESILQESDMTLGLAYVIGNRSLVFWKQGNNEIAKKDLFKAIDMLEPLGDRYGVADYYNQLGNIFQEEGDEIEAIKFTTKGLELAKEEGLKEQVRDASFLLFQLNRSVGEHELAADYLIQHYAYRDSIQNLETTQEIANLRTEFEVGQKQGEVDLLLQQRRSNQMIMVIGGITLFIVICLVIIVFIYYKTKVKLNTQLEEQKNSLISLNNTKDRFFSIISHDLRGPVGVLSGLVSITKYFIDDKKTDQLREMMDKMEHSVDRLVKLLDNLLHWALQQQGHFPYVPDSYSVKSLLSDAQDIFTDMAASKNIQLDVNVAEDFDIYVDKNTSSAIFRNLLNNAIKFTPKGGTVSVTAELNGSHMGHIMFQDSGVGMPKDKVQHLFELNEGKSTKGTSGESGLGLGLQLVNDFVNINKGQIAVASTVGQGSTFTVELPLHQQ
ncbi:MAG: tetratricopeptide repeat-containing sensor histidine kinase [Cytophagales bacterium]|nr:tetratricopeptide repeat-containing sensor histidine kinase [Cytophagales bacterium]